MMMGITDAIHDDENQLGFNFTRVIALKTVNISLHWALIKLNYRNKSTFYYFSSYSHLYGNC